MQYTDELKVTITTDLDGIQNKRNQKKQKGTLRFTDANGQVQTWDVRLSVRGKFRRLYSKGILPLKIYFEKEALGANGLADFNDLKLVTSFLEDKKEGKELLNKGISGI